MFQIPGGSRGADRVFGTIYLDDADVQKRDPMIGISGVFVLLFLSLGVLTAWFWRADAPPKAMLWFVWPICAAGVGVFGTVYMLTKGKPPGSRGRTRPEFLVAGGVVALVAAVVVAFSLANQFLSHETQHAQCVSRLKVIGRGLRLYADDHGGRFPPSFAELIEREYLSPGTFVCGVSRDEAASGATPAAMLEEFRQPGHCSYVYLGAGLTTAADPNTIIAYERLGNHKDQGTAVLYADGDVAWLNAIDAERLVQSLPRPANEPGVATTGQ